MKRMIAMGITAVLTAAVLSACGRSTLPEEKESEVHSQEQAVSDDQEPQGETGWAEESVYTRNTKIEDVIQDPAFGSYGRLIFTADTGYYSGDTLEQLKLVWYNNIDPDKTVEIVNYMRECAYEGEQIFYDIYTDEEKAADPAKEDTGLFFFRGNPGERFGQSHYFYL